jgi:hypothetical protein
MTYSTALTANRDKIRFRIGDTVTSAGPRPDKRNFSDEEIAFVLTEETTVNGAIAHLFEVLASEWTAYAVNEREGEVSADATQVAGKYAALAIQWRKKPGGNSTASGGIITLTPSDAWSEAAASEYT